MAPCSLASSCVRRAEAVLCSIQRRAEALGRRADNFNICASPGRNDPMKKLAFILVTAIAAFFSAAAYADDYPSRPITIVNVFGPGSASDTICRIIADKLSPALGQPVIVEDRPGADGALAALYVHHQPAD